MNNSLKMIALCAAFVGMTIAITILFSAILALIGLSYQLPWMIWIIVFFALCISGHKTSRLAEWLSRGGADTEGA